MAFDNPNDSERLQKLVKSSLLEINKLKMEIIKLKENQNSLVSNEDFEKLKLIFDKELGSKYILSSPNYKQNAKLISDVLKKHNIWHIGGKHSPYIWLKCPNNMNSWEFFDYLLEKVQIVGTPGSGFGKNGEGYFRLTSFGSFENTEEAVERLDKLFK